MQHYVPASTAPRRPSTPGKIWDYWFAMQRRIGLMELAVSGFRQAPFQRTVSRSGMDGKLPIAKRSTIAEFN
jgi:hypothetical protein